MVMTVLSIVRVCRNVAVASVMPFGCIVEFAPGKCGLVHVSELDVRRTADPTAVWKAGDKIDVKILEYDKASGRCKLSRYSGFRLIIPGPRVINPGPKLVVPCFRAMKIPHPRVKKSGSRLKLPHPRVMECGPRLIVTRPRVINPGSGLQPLIPGPWTLVLGSKPHIPGS